MHIFRVLMASTVCLAAPCLLLAADQLAELAYIHPKTDRFTDFTFISPLPAPFVNARPQRKEMGDQYLDFLGVIAIVGESAKQRADMRR